MDYKEIYIKYFRRLVYFADSILDDEEQAKDISQEALIKTWQRFDGFDNEKAITMYLYNIVRNTCLNCLKAKRRLTKKQEGFFYVSETSEQNILQLMMWTELLAEISNGVEKLPAAEANIFKLAYFQDMNTNQIAEQTGLSIKTIRNQRASAIAKLRLRFY